MKSRLEPGKQIQLAALSKNPMACTTVHYLTELLDNGPIRLRALGWSLLKKRLAEMRERRWRERDDDVWEEEAAIS